ncbi:hypothetical protein N665_1781s0002 [Sinapis alba]|nr:hypothetical protein N665_1781s0002 [Sinapis alba]
MDFLCNSTFGKIIAIKENPPFLGVFRQYVVVRLLKVNKKHKIWFLVSIVTGLNYGKIPDQPKKKKKNPLNEKLYWNELLGSLKFCTVDTVIAVLKKKKVKPREMIFKFFASLSRHQSFSPSSHTPRLIPEHVEMIRDLDEFLAYPWGRDTYLTLSMSLIAKDEIFLSQASVAIKGYIDDILLVLPAAIPQLKEEIIQNELVVVVESESEGETPDEDSKTSPETKLCVIPGHAKIIDNSCQVVVKSILDDSYEEWSSRANFDWIDEIKNAAVDNMNRLIAEDFSFRKEMFKGGLTSNDLACMRLEKKQKEKKNRKRREGSDPQSHIGIANFVTSEDISYEISSLERRLDLAMDVKIEKLVASSNHEQHVALLQATVSGSLQEIERKLTSAIVNNLKNMQPAVIKGLIDVIGKSNASRVRAEEAVDGDKLTDIPPFADTGDRLPTGSPETGERNCNALTVHG